MGHFKSACSQDADSWLRLPCPAGEINYYLLRSLGLNGGNDVHHAQWKHGGAGRGREEAWYIATDFRRLIENERSNISGLVGTAAGAGAGAGQPVWPCSRAPSLDPF